uniref:Uncharacterized protein n=1 Tax=Anguilla anguilla TaxID=7936 RepID=A0A0E9TSR3_ANGAN
MCSATPCSLLLSCFLAKTVVDSSQTEDLFQIKEQNSWTMHSDLVIVTQLN